MEPNARVASGQHFPLFPISPNTPVGECVCVCVSRAVPPQEASPSSPGCCLPAGAFAANRSSCLHLWNRNFHYKWNASVRKEQIVFVCALARPSVPPPHMHTHAGVQTSMLELRLCKRACVFRPFSVDSGKSAAPRWRCCLLFCNESVPHLRIRLQPARLSIGNC